MAMADLNSARSIAGSMVGSMAGSVASVTSSGLDDGMVDDLGQSFATTSLKLSIAAHNMEADVTPVAAGPDATLLVQPAAEAIPEEPLGWQNFSFTQLQDWAAQQVTQKIALGEMPDRTALLEDDAITQLRPDDIVEVPIYLATNYEEAMRVSMRADSTAYELGLTIMREAVLPLRPSLSFNGRLMDPEATLQAHNINRDKLSFAYSWAQQQKSSLTSRLLEEQNSEGMCQDQWKRCLIIVGSNGEKLNLQWKDGSVANDFSHLQARFPVRVKLESKVLAQLPAAIATCSEDKTARIWNSWTGKCEWVLRGHTAAINSACFAQDNASLVTCSEDHDVRLWSLITGECLHTLHGHTDSVSFATFSPDRAGVLTYSDDCTAKLWSLQSGQCIFTLKGHAAPVFLARFNEGGTITTASRDGKMFLWDASTGKYMRAVGGPLLGVELYSHSPGGHLTVTPSPNRETSVWDVASGRLELLLGGHERQVTQAIFSPASPVMVAAAEAVMAAKQQSS